ncbi:MAG: 3D domain-containing protein [Clostridia bacterium]|nr:3D domain-containing protein [Clostridia bacterium]
MLKTILAISAKVKNSNASIKFNKHICIALALIITISSISIATIRYSNSNEVKALSNDDTSSSTVATQSIAEETTEVPETTTYNNINLCKVTIVKHAKKAQSVIMRKNTAKKALSVAKVSVGSNDVVNCKLSSQVYDGQKIVINEVKYKNQSSTKKISYKKFKKLYPDQDASSLDEDSKVKVSKTVKIKYVNGVKTSSKLKSISYKSLYTGKKYSSLKTVSELKPAKDFKVNKKGIPLKYKKVIRGTASAYSCGTHTATGKRVKPGYIAVNPRQIPYGTKLYIRTADGSYTYGYASAEDTGGFVAWGNTVADLFFWSESACRSFGRRAVEIYVL